MRLEREPGGERIMVVGDTSYFPKLAGGRMELCEWLETTEQVPSELLLPPPLAYSSPLPTAPFDTHGC